MATSEFPGRGKTCQTRKCPGCQCRGPQVGWRGNPEAACVVVGESPGANELREGLPFVGLSGKMIGMHLPEFLEGDSNRYLVTNAMQCLPPKNKKNAQIVDANAQACHNRLMAEIQAHPRKIILAMGNAAVRSITGDYSLKITQIRGRLFKTPYASIGLIPVIHPAALMRGTGNYRKWVGDLLYAKRLLEDGSQARRRWLRGEDAPVNTPQEAVKVVNYLLYKTPSKTLFIDSETSGLRAQENFAICLGISTPEDLSTVWSFPRHLFPYLRPLFARRDFKQVYHNGKFDVQFLQKSALQARVDEDTMLLSYALEEQGGLHDLEQVAGDLLDAPDYKHVLKPWLPTRATSYTAVPYNVLTDYQATDVSNTGQIFSILRRNVRDDEAVEKLYTRTLIPASKLLAEVEQQGILIDPEQVQRNAEDFKRQVDDKIDTLCQIAGFNHNPNSPAQISDILYNKLKLPNKAKGSTARPILEKLPRVPYVEALLEHRKVAKAYSTYVKPYFPDSGAKNYHVHTDGRVHPTFLIHGTQTGRLASRNPNVQNIPRLASLRGQFIASPGYVFIECDLNQAELRSLAALSGDQRLLAVFNEGRSLHDEVSIALFGPHFTGEQRMRSKAVNFGIVYGRTGPSIAKEFDMPSSEGQSWVDGWFATYPQAKRFIDMCRKAPLNGQVMVTCFGRKKRYGVITRDRVHDIQNESANFPHQSIASDINLHAAIRVAPKIKRFGARIVDLVHDSILIECPAASVAIREVAKLTTLEQESVAPDWGITAVPFLADCKIGTRWGTLHTFDPDGPVDPLTLVEERAQWPMGMNSDTWALAA